MGLDNRCKGYPEVRKAYLDNMIDSARTEQDLVPIEMEATKKLLEAEADGKLKLLASGLNSDEQAKTKDEAKRLRLAQAERLPRVEKETELLGMNISYQLGGAINSPIMNSIIDPVLMDTFHAPGSADKANTPLAKLDAQHLMYAVANGCDWFVTTDPIILNNKVTLEKSCRGLLIVRPSELVAELGL